MKKVLIAMDYDPSAQKVAKSGFLLAKSLGSEVILLHVIADPVYYASVEYSPIMGLTGDMSTYSPQLENVDGLRKVSQQFLDKLNTHFGENTAQTMILEGDFAESILKAAKNSHADIIVMGSHSRKWLENIIMGSVTAEVLQKTSIPLFIVPTKKNK